MKNSAKLFAASFFVNNAKAQTMSTMSGSPLRFGIAIETGLPAGNLAKVSMVELGGT